MKLGFLPFLLAVLSYLTKDVAAKLEPYIWCGACIAMVEDMKIQISAVDKRKKLQVGSFRIMADGSQNLKEVPYATSDLFLTEELERICNAMHHYAETKNQQSGQKIIIRTSSYDGTSVSMKNIVKSAEITQALTFACQTIIEDHEDEIIKLLKGYNKKDCEVEKDICVNQTGLCTEDDIKTRMWAMANAVMAGIQEKADERLKESQAQEELDRQMAEEQAKAKDEDSKTSDSEEEVGEDVTEQLVREGSIDITEDEKDEL